MDILIFCAIVWLIANTHESNRDTTEIRRTLRSIDSNISDIKDIIERDKK